MVACRSGLTVPSPGCAPPAEGLRQCLRRAARRQLLLSSAQRVAIADLRFAAWFLWMTPLLAALSRLCDAVRMATVAASTSPASAASRKPRTAVFSDDLTALLRCLAFSFCLLRLIWDLMFATRMPAYVRLVNLVCPARAEGAGAPLAGTAGMRAAGQEGYPSDGRRLKLTAAS